MSLRRLDPPQAVLAHEPNLAVGTVRHERFFPLLRDGGAEVEAQLAQERPVLRRLAPFPEGAQLGRTERAAEARGGQADQHVITTTLDGAHEGAQRRARRPLSERIEWRILQTPGASFSHEADPVVGGERYLDPGRPAVRAVAQSARIRGQLRAILLELAAKIRQAHPLAEARG